MGSEVKYAFPSEEWFQMQEREVRDALSQADMPHGFRFSLVERFLGGSTLANGMMQGFRIEIDGPNATFRRGVLPDESAEAVIEITMEGLDRLVHMSSHDPALPGIVEQLTESGHLVRRGPLERVASLSHKVHHRVFEQTL